MRDGSIQLRREDGGGGGGEGGEKKNINTSK